MERTVSPFVVDDRIQSLIENLAKDTTIGKRIKEAFAADLLTSDGQRLFLDVAKENKWLQEGKEDDVIVSEVDGVRGFMIFRDTFSKALSFFYCSVEGNHRIIAAICALLKCKPNSCGPIKAANPGDNHHFSGDYAGIDSDDPLVEEFDLEDGESCSTFNTVLQVDLLGSKKQATPDWPAELLLEKIQRRLSEIVAETKRNSSYRTTAAAITPLVGPLMPEKNVSAKSSDGSFYMNGIKIEEGKKTKKEDSAFYFNDVLSGFVHNPSAIGKHLQGLLSDITFKETGTDNHMRINDTRLSIDNAIISQDNKTLRRSITEIIGTALASVLEVDEAKRRALLFVDNYYGNSAVRPRIDMTNAQKEMLGVYFPGLFKYSSEESKILTLNIFITEWFIAANVNNAKDLLTRAINQMNTDMASFGESNVKESLGKFC